MASRRRKITVEIIVKFDEDEKVRSRFDAVPKRIADIVAGDWVHIGGVPALIIRVDDLQNASDGVKV